MKKWLILAFLLLLVPLCISVIQRLQYSAYKYPEDPYWRLKQNYQLQQPLNVVFQVKDQFGEPAVDYRFMVLVRGVRWFYWIYPYWSQFQEEYPIQTDGNGTARLGRHFHCAYVVGFQETNREKYIFPYGQNRRSPRVFADSPTWPFPLPRPDHGTQMFQMMVLKHGPASNGRTYHPAFPERHDGVVIVAQDTNMVVLDLLDNRFSTTKEDGDLVVYIKNARHAAETYYRQFYKGRPWPDHPVWTVRVEGRKGTVVQPVYKDYVTYAPVKEYVQGLTYRMSIEESPTEGEVEHFANGIWGKNWLMKENGMELDFGVVTPSADFAVFGKTSSPFYFYVRILIDVRDDGTILVRPSGYYNPDGTNNLW